MKRRQLIKHLKGNDCELIREGSNHSWWGNKESGKRTAVPRHAEVDDMLARKICNDLGIPRIK